MKTFICGRTKIRSMWNTHRVGVTADNIVRHKASSLTVLRHSLTTSFNSLLIITEPHRNQSGIKVDTGRPNGRVYVWT